MSTQPPGRPPHAGWLVLPEVTRAIEGALRRKRLRGAELEDHRQIVLERALQVASPPASLGECIAMVQTIATNLVADTVRKKKSRSKVDAGPYKTPDERPANAHGDVDDRIDDRRQLEFVRGEIETGNISAREAAILTSAADEVSQLEIAADLKLAHSTVRNELAAVRRKVRIGWAAFATVTLAFFGVVFMATRPPPPVGSAPPPPSAVPPEDRPLEVAEAMRERAFDACDRHEWAECLQSLDDARLFDPAGDGAPLVQRTRAEATRRLHEPAPPGAAAPSSSAATPATK
jgi:DNA-directed RNA polymerase specialized sigma24 family protein